MNMRFVKALVAVSAIAMGANAAQAATASADAKAVILAPITIVKASDLDFGTIAVNGAGVVSIPATSNTADCDGASGDLICSGTTTRAAFNVTGINNAAVAVTVDSAVQLNSGANSMSASLTTGTLPTALSATGTASFFVGGDLTVAATQAAGSYVGDFDVTVVYN